jgi:methionyl-tRNA formyltransferase
MKIVVFCDTMGQFPRFWQAFRGTSHRLHFIVCNNGRRRKIHYGLLQLAHAARTFRIRDWTRLLADLKLGSICIDPDKLGSFRSLKFLESVNADVGLHAMGVIYRQEVIDRFKNGILNAHIGQLPSFRGRSVMEWSILCGAPAGVTVFFIDTGVDTGSTIVHWEPVQLSNFVSVSPAKRHLFSMDAELYRMAVEKIESDHPTERNQASQGLRFYEMSSLLKSVVEDQLRRRDTGRPPRPTPPS